jgi:vacuolar-type H+-ATPase subunit E/Vma4
MRLDALREALVAQARQEASALEAEAERAAAERVQSARSQAARLTEQAKADGREQTERAVRRRLSSARRHGREVVLRARRDALDRLRDRVVELLRDAEHTAGYSRLMADLASRAREQLGESADMIDDPAVGGFVARSGGRVVDYRLPEVVARTMEDMGDELEDLWR